MNTKKLVGLYQPLTIPNMPKQQFYNNFVMKFPEDDWYSMIMTCVDCLSKLLVLVPLCEFYNKNSGLPISGRSHESL